MYESISCGGPLCSFIYFEVTNLTIDHSVETHSLSLPVPVHPRWLAISLICMNLLFLFAVLVILLSSLVIKNVMQHLLEMIIVITCYQFP